MTWLPAPRVPMPAPAARSFISPRRPWRWSIAWAPVMLSPPAWCMGCWPGRARRWFASGGADGTLRGVPAWGRRAVLGAGLAPALQGLQCRESGSMACFVPAESMAEAKGIAASGSEPALNVRLARVRMHHTDLMGCVYHGTYFDLFEDARSEMFR